jgi:hypothetical protein
MQAIILRLKILLAVLFAIMVVGTAGFVIIEKKSIVEAAYFIIVTVATVGYGDIHPATQTGKVNNPFLFHLAMRTNPFDRSASITVK